MAPLLYSIVFVYDHLPFFIFLSVNYITWICSKLYSVMPWSVIFLLYFSDGINKGSCSIYVFSVLKRRHVSFITKQKEIYIFWSFCEFKDTTDAIVRNNFLTLVLQFTISFILSFITQVSTTGTSSDLPRKEWVTAYKGDTYRAVNLNPCK